MTSGNIQLMSISSFLNYFEDLDRSALMEEEFYKKLKVMYIKLKLITK